MRIKYLSILSLCVVASLSFNSIAGAQYIIEWEPSPREPNLLFVQNVPITPFSEFPTATSEFGPITYSIYPALPDGLEYNADTRTLSGTPLTAYPTTSYSYSASIIVDKLDTTYNRSLFKITVQPNPYFGTATIYDKKYIQDIQITPITLPFAVSSGSFGPITYSIYPALPDGLTFNGNNREITGRPRTLSPTTEYTYTATDTLGSTDSLTFSITVEEDTVHFSTATIYDKKYIQDIRIAPITLPIAVLSGSFGRITYSITPTLPDGLTFNGNNRKLVGVPRTTLPTTEFTYTATHTLGSTDSLTFSITVEEDTVPVAPASTSAFTYRINYGGQNPESRRRRDSFCLPRFTGGNGRLSYKLLNRTSLPWGLYSPHPESRCIEGTIIDTAEDQSSITTHTYTATDEDGDSASKTFILRVIDNYPAPPTVQDREIFIGESVYMGSRSEGANYIPLFNKTEYEWSPTEYRYSYAGLPPGLAPVHHRSPIKNYPNDIEGTPNTLGTYRVTYTYTNSVGESPSTTFTISVVERTFWPPTRQQSYSFSVGEVVNQTLDAFSGGVGSLSYGLTDGVNPVTSLVSGLSFEPQTRTISGTIPPGTSDDDSVPATTYTYTATDDNGNVATTTLTITIIDSIPQAPPSPQVFDFELGQSVSVTLKPFTGGDGTLTYALREIPALSEGLEFNSSTRTISGTIPPGTSDDDSIHAMIYTYTATDKDGDSNSAIFTIEIADTVGVVDDLVPVAPTIRNRTFSVGQFVTAILPPFTGGDGILTYSLLDADGVTPVTSLVGGLTFLPQSSFIYGTIPGTSGDDSIPATTYTYTATDDDGTPDTTDDDTASVNFTITIVDDMPAFATNAIADISAPLGTPIDFVQLPRGAPNSITTITPSLSPDLPSGLTFRPISRRIYGIPIEPIPTTTYEYKVTDEDGDTATLTFTITVEDAILVKPISNKEFRFGEEVWISLQSRFFGLMHLFHLDGPLTYSLTDGINPVTSLIGGLHYSRLNREICGTVKGTAGDDSDSATYTYSATDDDGDTGSFTFTITIVDEIPDFGSATIADISGTKGTAISPVTFPEVFTAGTWTTTYTLTPQLPSGLEFDNNPSSSTYRQLSGTPISLMPTTTYTYTATDVDGDTDSITFTITVVEGQVPQDDDAPVAPTISNFEFAPLQSVSTNLPSFTGGNGELTHSLTDADGINPVTALIGGLNYEPQTRTISGTVTGTAGDDSDSATYTYSATDSGDVPDITSTTFTISIVDEMPDFGSVTIAPVTVTQDTAITPVTLPQVLTTGTRTTTYSLIPELPAGLVFDNNPSSSTYRQLSGTPDIEMATTAYEYTATDLDGDTTTLTFTITGVESQVPQGDTIPVAPSTPQAFVFVPGEEVSVNLLPFTGGDGELTYALSPLSTYLPDGLVFDVYTLTISGTLPADTTNDDSVSATTYTYTATDEDGDEASATFTLEVLDSRPVAPATVPDLTFTLDQHNHGVLPAFTTSADHLLNVAIPELTYSLAAHDGGALPSWLSIDTVTHIISGTPEITSTFIVLYTATDGVDSDSVTFTITVVEGQVPQDDVALEAPTISNFEFAPLQSVSTNLPSFTGGNGELTHSLTDGINPVTSLIGGLNYEPQTRTISGTVAGTAGDDSDSATYTYSATDSGIVHDTTSTTFTIAIVDEIPDFGSVTIADVTVTQDSAITPISLPQVSTAGTGTTTYSLTPAVFPFGLSFDADARVLSGTPIDVMPTRAYEYTATDEDGDTTTLTFTITIGQPQPPKVVEDTKPITPSTSQDFVFAPGQAVSVTLLSFTGGDGVLNYALSSSLPAGLVFSASTRTVSGTVPGTSNDDSVPATTYTYTATDEDGDTDSATFTITIVDSVPVAPSAARSFVFEAGQVVSETLELFTGGDGTLTYALSPSLPSGLSYDSNSRVISGTVANTAADDSVPATTYTYSATDGDGDEATVTFTIEVLDSRITAPTVPNYTFDQDVPLDPITLPSFSSTSGQTLTYTLEPLPHGLNFNKDTLVLAGTPTVAGTSTVTYTATDLNGKQESVIFTISVIEFYFTAPAVPNYTFTKDKPLDPITLPSFSSTSGQSLTYTLEPLPKGLTFNKVTLVLAGTPTEAGVTEDIMYSATDPNGSYARALFSITVVNALALETTTTGALPSVGANVALVATEAISTRVGLALDGQSQGLDIRTAQGQQFKLGASGANAQSSSTASAIRFGAWYSTSHDELSNTQTDLAWNGITDSTNVGIDIGFDLSSKASLVFGVMQNASATSATYGDASGDGSGVLDVDLDATTFYVGFGYDWLDVWFANGSASSMLNDSARDGVIPTSFAYQTIGLTAAFDFTDGFQVGAKVESLNSALSLSSQEALNYKGLESDSSQFRTAFFVNYKLDLGKDGNAQFIPKFEMGYRGLTQNSNSSATAASAGTAAETSFGADYLQKQLNLTIGFSIRSFEVQNYASESTQWHIRWESSTYDKGLSLQLRPTVVAESLGLDALYNSDYSQYQSLLSRQYGGDTSADDDGLDFEMGYGITFGSGTYTPFVKTTNFVFGQAANNSRRTQEVGIRYTTPSGLDLTLAMERLYSPSGVSSGVATSPLMQRENSLEFTTRYNF